MPTDQVRGLKTCGSSPAKGIFGCVWIIATTDFPQPNSRGSLAGRSRSMKKAVLRSGLVRLGGLRHMPPAASIAAPANTSMCQSTPLAGEMSKLLD